MSPDPFFGATNHAGIKWYSSEKPLVLWTLNGSLPKIWFFKTLESDREVENQGVKEPVCWENPIKFQGYRLGKAISTLGSRKETYIHQGRDWPTSKFFKSELSNKSPEPAILRISESPHPCPGAHRMPPVCIRRSAGNKSCGHQIYPEFGYINREAHYG